MKKIILRFLQIVAEIGALLLMLYAYLYVLGMTFFWMVTWSNTFVFWLVVAICGTVLAKHWEKRKANKALSLQALAVLLSTNNFTPHEFNAIVERQTKL